MSLARMAGLYLALFAGGCLWLSQASSSELRIHDIQGRTHVSPFKGEWVTAVRGIVTAVRTNGFYMQDHSPDQDEATSEAIFVFTQAAPKVAVGNAVEVDGQVDEFRPAVSSAIANLSTTNIVSPAVRVLSEGNPLPVAVELGAGGRTPPLHIRERSGGVDASKDFDPTQDALDFYESLEAMRVQMRAARVIAPLNAQGDLAIIGEDAQGRLSPRGALLVDAAHFNPQRIFLSHSGIDRAQVGDRLENIQAVLDYRFGHYTLHLTTTPSRHSVSLMAEHATNAHRGDLSIAVYNVENLDGRDAQWRFDRIAEHIVCNLQEPDIVGLLEIQDSNGAVDDGNVDAGLTLKRLTEAIARLGGPLYNWSAIDPGHNEDGGEPGANIRQVFLFDPARVSLAAAPVRIAPGNSAFYSSRKPLVQTFRFRQHLLHAVLNHFVSKRADEPLFGVQQPPRRPSEGQRQQQAKAVAHYIRTLGAEANAVVLGDLNDFEFGPALGILAGGGLHNLTLDLPPEERYTYIHEGNAQALDHALVSAPLVGRSVYDIVHINAEYPAALRASDHDPVLLRLRLQ
ncbi:MAG TPA: endonuclease/exonuclease/phosphatase family protein, partial [Burkholderiales bacterium]|nr:endonuclease/exonuclease/phosphatase family protein [Burkholderiales bacterium]